MLRELGERLVKQPEVAIVELIKNAYDANATQCTIHYDPQQRILVEDDGDGITFDRFRDSWMQSRHELERERAVQREILLVSSPARRG